MIRLPTDPVALVELYLSGVLDPPDAAEVERRLAVDANLMGLLQQLSAEHRPQAAPASKNRWRIPPPGLFTSAQLVRAPVFSGSDAARTRVRLHVAAVDQPGDRELVVLIRKAANWVVLSPTAEAERVPVDKLNRLKTGDLLIDLHIPHETERLALAFPLSADVDLTGPPEIRWIGLQGQIAQAAAPFVSLAADLHRT